MFGACVILYPMIQHVVGTGFGYICVGVGMFVSEVFVSASFHGGFAPPPIGSRFEWHVYVMWDVKVQVLCAHAAFGLHCKSNPKKQSSRT